MDFYITLHSGPTKHQPDYETKWCEYRPQKPIEFDGEYEIALAQYSDNSYLQSNLFYRDDAGRFDRIGSQGDLNFVANSGYVKRNKIMNANLLVRKAQINPSVMLGHALAFGKTTEKCPIKRVVVKQHTLGKGVSSKVITNISSSSLPSRVVIGFVKKSAYDGFLDQNPFNFGHFNLNQLNLMVDEQSSPYYKPLEFNFAKNQYIRGYYSLFENIDKPVFATGNYISREDYPKGYSLFAFDLIPDLCNGDQFTVIKTGNLDVGLTFANSIVVIFYLEYDNLVGLL
ncbi:unnamed protein product [Brachionus calyciflorus]|uniref:Uncharacterized protein n=1 Tax=Brachionus calyciflorus TaxID=104777 RepID=A0A814DP42_9BILA|nr:unnamed protein product [Brachionus calyciflorus]